MLVANLMADLELEVWDCLEAVTDPELDEPITDMNFVEHVEVDDEMHVSVEVRLPTYWRSPNFAFLMAFGIRQEVMSLPWVRNMEVKLNDHCFGEEVNEGVNSGRNYQDVFAQYCDGANLDEVVETFLAKAFDRRQEVVLLGLQEMGFSAEKIVSMTLKQLQSVQFKGEEEQRQLPRYIDILSVRGSAPAYNSLAFPTWEGKRLEAGELDHHLGRLRSTRINMEFNGALCRGLASTRYKEVEIGPEGPTLIDFIAGRVPVAEKHIPNIK